MAYCRIHKIQYTGTCPLCADAARPSNPSLEDEDPTMPPGPSSHRSSVADDEDDMPTDYGVAARGRKKILLDDDEEETQYGRRGRSRFDEDLTETEYDQAPTGKMAILWVKEGRRRGHVYKVKDGYVVGRDKGDIVLDDSKVSNPHAKFTLEEGQFVVWDFGSKNGTFVNGSRIRAATPLNENDVVKMGEMVFVLKVLD